MSAGWRHPALRRPEAMALAAAPLACLVGALVLPGEYRPAAPLVLLTILAAFLLTESVQLDLDLRRQTYILTTTELVLVMGLVEVGGFWTALMHSLALVLIQAYQRYPLAKSIFNVASAILTTAAAVLVLSAFPPLDLSSPLTWLGLVVAIAVADLVSLLCVATAISLTGGRPDWSFWFGALGPQVVIGPLSVAAAVASLLLVGDIPWAWLLVLPVLVAIVAAFRLTASASRERRSIQQVYDFARQVEGVSPDDAGTRQMVAAVRELLNADKVALWLPPYLDEAPRLVVVGDGQTAYYDGPGDPDDVLRRRALQPGAGGPVLVTAGRATPEEAAALARRGAEEVLGAPVTTAAGEPGYLEVCDRRSDVVSFSEGDRSALDSMLTHVNAAIRQQQLLTQIRYDADHDRLTGLPNRQRLAAEIDHLLTADPVGARAGLVLAALDNHTEIVDTLGHAAADELLLVTAGLLREHAPPDALVARMEGEQFAVLLPGLSLAAAERAARRLREATSTRARVAGLDLEVTLTIGVAAAPVHGTDAGTLMQRADVALLAASDGGGGRVASYHQVLDQQSLRRLQLGTELEHAMADGQISVVFQPIIDARTSDIVSVETLVRWAHPRFGAIPPDDFIHLAEQIGRIGPLTDHVLDLALARCRRWLDQDIALSVAVNLSARCLTEPDLVERVQRALRRHGVPGELLILELTEGSVVDDSVRSSNVLAELHALGLRLSMDDFGTGYSSLSQLRQLPIDEVKIDKSFVLGMSTSQGESFIARSIIELAHNLGLRVVAEGVEDELTRKLLTEMGCDKLQGFLVSRPLPDERLESWLLARTGVRSAAPGAQHRRLFVRT
ncbi:diguanylate cyclase (GGDEF)-like protein [Geodermatophilus bullaregiensis]|uniref:putative bifunctional diguanylate cyclase/phosphodiesterase n=1 Tax=Geodermatophilus bullaregiensis TaxID=1564160 RepID=UPI00195670B0|nr:bifunctional diguanylate cyclase/phosphodiesterase [Geodermatophilus bullaregiensis]MBM7806004.1 diguanylate cyclase (GGDEF)-like protein [Geodermatophilus bullaregiensis]